MVRALQGIYSVKVLHVITSLEAGGAESMLYKLCRALIESSDRTTQFSVLTLVNKGKYLSLIRGLGIEVRSLGMTKGTPTLSAIFKARRLIREIQPDLIQSWMYHSNILAAIATPIRIPLFWNIRQSLYRLKNEKWHTALSIVLHRFFAIRVRKIVFNSHTSIKQHKSYLVPFHRKSHYIPNGFDQSIFYPCLKKRQDMRKKFNIGEDTKLIGNFSRFHPMKNHDFLFRIFRDYLKSQESSNIKLALAGKGIHSRNQELIRKIRNYLTLDNVVFFGEDIEVSQGMNAIDLYVQTSAWGEAFPNLLGEALLCNCPVLATDIGDSRYIVGKESLLKESPDCIEQIKTLFDCRKKHDISRIDKINSESEVLTKYLNAYHSLT